MKEIKAKFVLFHSKHSEYLYKGFKIKILILLLNKIPFYLDSTLFTR